jgi:glyoxylase-like metal-dependent hydrolase (beta-lactamase superfamily II)
VTPSLPLARLGGPVSNAWLLPDTPAGPVLVDAGFGTAWPGIVAGLRLRGLRVRDLGALILTHRHLDHAANAMRIQRHGVPVYAHGRDAAMLTGDAAAPPLLGRPGPVAVMCAMENRIPPRLERVTSMADGDVIAGLEVIHAPGHTVGSCLLYHRPSGTLFTGDALINAVPPYVTREALSLPFPDFCDDYPKALDSLRRLVASDLDIRRLCTGHGRERRGPIREALAALLAAA